MVFKKIVIFILLLFSSNILFARNSISVLLPGKRGEEVWKNQADYLTREANKRNINITIFYADNNNKKQYTQMGTAVANLVDAIVLYPVDYLQAGLIVDVAAQEITLLLQQNNYLQQKMICKKNSIIVY